MLAKSVVSLLLIGIVVSLFAGLVFMLRDPSRSRRTVRALTMRVSLQLALMAFLIAATVLGWIHPHGLGG